MKTDERRFEQLLRELDPAVRGTMVLVAVEGFFEPGRECLAGELLMPRAWCGRQGCSCGEEFHGISTHGNASVARVQRLRGTTRALVETTIAAAMRHHEGFDRPELVTASVLDEVAGIEDGRLVRREDGILLPFPAAARIVGGHHIEYHVTDEP